MRRPAAMALLLLAFVTAGAPPSRADVVPRPGTVVVSDRLGRRDAVTFYFPMGAADAAGQVRRAAAAGGLEVRTVTVDDEAGDGLVHVRLGTTLGRRTGLFSRRIEAPALTALDLARTGQVVVHLHPGAEVKGGPPPVHEDVFGRKFSVPTTAPVDYRVPVSWLARIVALLLVVVGLPHLARLWGMHVEAGPGDDVDKVHRLQVGMSVAFIVLPLLTAAIGVLSGIFFVPDMLLSEVAPGLTHARASLTLVPLFLFMAGMIVTFVAGFLGAQPVDRRLRATDDSALSAGRRFARAVVVMFLPLTAWLLFLTLTPDTALFRLAGLVALLLLLNVAGPALVLSAQETYRLESPLREQLVSMCAAQGLRVRDVRGIRARSARVANAMITGVLPGARYVLLTDHLLDNLTDDELQAILCHEIGHGVEHHLLKKTGSWLGLVAVLSSAGALVALADNVALSLALLVLLIGIFVAQGRIGVRLEERADDYACRQVGVEPVVRALEKVAALNMTKRHTGALWDAMQQHPGVERRIARLQPAALGARRF